MQLTSEKLFLLAIFVVGFGAYITIVMDVATKNSKQAKLRHIAKRSKQYRRFYDNPLTRKSFRRIVTQLSSLQMYSILDIRVRSVEIYRNTMMICGAILIFGALSLRDIVMIALLYVFVMMMQDILIQKKIDASQTDLTVALSRAVASLRDNYTRYNEIPRAVEVCERATILDKTFENIYAFLTEANGEERLNVFYLTQTSPVLKTLASTCFLLDRYGDSTDRESGVSSFKQALMFIKDEVDLEIRKITKRKLLFGKLEYLPVAPLLLTGILENFFIQMIPGTSILYKGLYGYIIKLLVIVTGAYGYNYISSVTRNNYSRVDDRLKIVDSLLEHKSFLALVNRVQNKKAKVIYKLNKRISGCLSSKDIPYVYGEKILFSVSVFIFSFLASIIISISSKYFIYNNINSFSFSSSDEYTQEEEDAIRALDVEFLARETIPSDEEIKKGVEGILPWATVLDIDDHVSRIKKKYTTYHNLSYQWYYAVAVILLTVLAWFVPEMLIGQREKLIAAEAEEDVLQMHTIVLILSSTSLDTQEVLYWLSKNSSIHRDHLNFAFQEYTSDPEKAIARLKKHSVLPEFHQLCDRLMLTVFKITMPEAFSDLVPERAHLMKIREMVQDNTLSTKRTKASMISKLPLYILIFGMIVLPLLILGVSQYTQIMSNLQF